MVTPQDKRKCVEALENEGLTQRKSCQLVGVCRDTARYISCKQDKELRVRIQEIANERRRFGDRRIHVLLKREGLQVNYKKVFRLYQEMALKVRKRGSRKKALGLRLEMKQALRPNERWSLDFVNDTLQCGRKIRLLVIIDDYTRECLRIMVDTGISGEKVKRALDQLIDIKENQIQFALIMEQNLPPMQSSIGWKREA